MTLPTGAGTSGYVLQTNGFGVTSWVPAGSGGTALSSIVAATTTNSIDSAGWAQIWKWGTLTTQTALSLTTSSMTSGTLLKLANTAAAATSTGTVLNVTNASTGTGYGVYASITGHNNTGYAGYFINTDTGSTNPNYGGAGWALSNTNTTAGLSSGVFGECDGANCVGLQAQSNNGSAIFANSNNGTGVNAESELTTDYANAIIGQAFGATGITLGVQGSSYSTGAGIGIQGNEKGTANTGYGGYFSNTATTGWALYAGTAPSYFAGSVGTGTTTPTSLLTIGGTATLNATPRQTIQITEQGYAAPSADQSLSNGDKLLIWNAVGNKVGIGADAYKLWFQASGGPNSKISFFTGATVGVGPLEVMSITPTGSVGIGTTAPAAALDIAQGTVTTALPVINAIGTWNASGVTFTGIKENITSTKSATGSLLMDLQVGGTSLVKIDKAGQIYLTDMIMSSDRRLKKHIESLDPESALDDIVALRPVTFTWKKTGEPDMGLIAQEVEPVFPALVMNGAADKALALKYSH